MKSISQGDRDGTRLPRGPHRLTPEEVSSDQRARLIAAMTRLAGSNGYNATPVAELIEQAGVSRKTFYALFANREELLKAAFAHCSDTILSIAGLSVARARRRTRRLEALMRPLCDEASERPGSIALCAVEITAAKLGGTELRASFMHAYAALLSDALGTGDGALPASVTVTLAGALHRQLDAYRRDGRVDELPGLVPQLARWVSSYHPPPAGLGPAAELAGSRTRAEPNSMGGGRAPGTLSLAVASMAPIRGPSREAIAHARRERILDAVAQLNSEQGYAALTAEKITARAELPPRSFRRHFASVEESFAAAVELGHMKGQAIVERARAWPAVWSESVMEGIHALLEFLGSEPLFTRLAFVDAPLVGPEMARRSNEHAAGYGRLLLDGAPARSFSSAVAPEAVGQTLFELAYRYAAGDRLAELHRATALTGYIAIAPFLGGALAAAAASAY
jgi:AcrR family transcriptional regulator